MGCAAKKLLPSAYHSPLNVGIVVNMKLSFLLWGLPVLLTAPLAGCGSSSAPADANSTTLASNTATGNGIASAGVPGAQPTIALPPEAPPKLLPDIVLPASLANPVADKDYGRFFVEVMKAYGDELSPLSESLGRSIAALKTLGKAPLQEPNYTEVITALRDAQTAVEDTDARTNRMARYIRTTNTLVSAMEVSNPISGSWGHFQKGLTYTDQYLTTLSHEATFMRDTCHAMRDALTRGDRNTYEQSANALRDHNYEETAKDEQGFEEFKTARQQYDAAPVN